METFMHNMTINNLKSKTNVQLWHFSVSKGNQGNYVKEKLKILSGESAIWTKPDAYNNYKDKLNILLVTDQAYTDIYEFKHSEMDWDGRCKNKKTNGFFISSFSGIAAPYWLSGFNDIYYNLNKKNENEIIRAGMESIGLLVNDIIDMLKNNIELNSNLITASGGAAKDSLLQFISNITGQIISRPQIRDKTAIGVFRILTNNNNIIDLNKDDDVFYPVKNRKKMNLKINKWRKIISSIS